MTIPLPPLKFKCMYETCRRTSLETGAVCRWHMNFEVACFIVAGSGVMSILYWFLKNFK